MMRSLPTYNPRIKTWGQKIGYAHTKNGTRDRKFFYFPGPPGTTPPPDVIADAVAKQREWADVVESWPEVGPALAAQDGEREFSLPVWYDRHLLEQTWDLDAGKAIAEANVALADYDATEAIATLADTRTRGADVATIVNELRRTGVIPAGTVVTTRPVTIREAINEYLSNQRARIDLKIGDRITIGTYNTKRNNLLLCLGCNVAKEWTQTTTIVETDRPLLDLDKPLTTLSKSDIEAIAKHWFTLPDGEARRSIKNYFSGLEGFISWCDEREEYGFITPKGTAKRLTVKGGDDAKVTAADYPALKALLIDAPERTKMYVLLGLFCGFYQSDICQLLADEVETRDDEMFITGYRSKEDSEAKAESKIKVTHWVPKEIAVVLEAGKAPANEWGLYFLNRYNRPMFSEKIEGGKSNAVSKAWEKISAGKTTLTFRQLRKWGWNEIQRFADTAIDNRCVGETMARRWAGRSGGGVAKAYRFDDYRPVIDAQRAWWAEIHSNVW